MVLLTLLPLVLLGVTANVNAHGVIKNCTVNGVKYEGYDANDYYQDLPMVGWRTPTDHNHGYVLPKDVNTEDIICHKGATPADLSVIVKAGDTITCGWTRWPDGHHGPIMNYFGNCNGPCAKADKTKVKFNKMSELGLIHPIKGVKIGDVVNYQTAGYWGTDKFSFEDHYKVSFTVPEDAATGEYIYRNELIALHSAMATAEGAQLYPQCISLKVTAKEGATNTDDYTDGTLGMELYSPEDPGFHIDIYRNPGTYQIPGPKVRTGHGSSTDNKTPVSSAASEMATSSATYQVASSTMASQEASSTMASQEASSTVASQEASSTVASQEVSATVSPYPIESAASSGTPKPSPSYGSKHPTYKAKGYKANPYKPSNYTPKPKFKPKPKTDHPSSYKATDKQDYHPNTKATYVDKGSYLHARPGLPDLAKMTTSQLLDLIAKVFGLKRKHPRDVKN